MNDRLLKKYLREDEFGVDAAMGSTPPMGGGLDSLGMGGAPQGKKLSSVPGDPKEKAIAAASAAVDNLKKSLLSIDELETMRDKLAKYCDDFKNGLKSRINDNLSPANRPWSNEND